MKAKDKLLRNFVGTFVVVTFVGLAVFVLSGCASASKCVVENGCIVVGSPFDLEIGSTEYANMFGSLIQTSAHAVYDPDTKTTTTNWHHHVAARLATPYFGCDRLSLFFKGEEKVLEHCHLSIGDNWVSEEGKTMSYAECRETVDRIAADIGRRLGITMRCRGVNTEAETMDRVRKSLEEYRRRKEKCFGLARGFVHYAGERTCRNVQVDYRVSGMLNDKGKCSIHVSCSKRFDPLSVSCKTGDRIPVYTNAMSSAASWGLMPSAEQKQAHDDAKRLRETINRLFGIDLDRPMETNEFFSVLWKTNAQTAVKREWMPMPTPFEGMTECKINQSVRFLAIPFGLFAIRCPFDGDVAEDELKAQAKRFLARLESEYGAKIPKVDSIKGRSLISKLFGEGIPTFGDTKVALGLDKTQYFIGKVGDISVEISYSTPFYAKKGGGFEMLCKGAVVVNIIQSPIIANGRARLDEKDGK